MSDAKHNQTQYQTGKVSGPRHHGTLVAVLLVMVVLLSGIITLLSVLNIRLFVALKNQEDSALQLQSLTASAEGTSDTRQTLSEDSLDLDIQMESTDVESETLTPQQIYANCCDSLVEIRCDTGEGTGVILDETGYIVTNYHAIRGATQIQVRLADQRRLTARLVGTDPATDLAVLRVSATNLTPAAFGDSDAVQVGDPVCVVVDQYEGILSNSNVAFVDGNQIGTDAAEYQFGPLLDRFGQVVGIHAVLQDGATGLAIPSGAVKQIAQQLIRQGYVSGRPVLGASFEPVTERYQYFYNLPAGLYITEAVDAVLERGDILLTLDGTPITNQEELTAMLCRFKAGDTACVEILRDGSRVNVTVTIDEAG